MRVESNEAAVRALLEAWAHSVETRDLDGIVEHHAGDILMFDVPTVRLEGIDAYKESWLEMFPWLGEEGRFKLSDMSIHAGEEVAFASAIIHCAGTELLRGGTELTIRLTVGLVKRDDQWTVTHEHHSEPAPT
jgi:uncharacterized protein (TIGR02246 family)